MIRNFFENYKKLENKEVVIKEIYDKDIALKIVEDSYQLYLRTFK